MGSMSLIVSPLCTGLMRAWLSHAGSRHRHTLLFGLGIMTNLLHYDVLFPPAVPVSGILVVFPALF